MIELAHVSKAFGGVQALEDVSLSIGPGEVRGLCGENGAGKSTLIRIAGGMLRPDRGTVAIGGSPMPPGARAAEDAGIVVVHQEPLGFPDLDAVENIFAGRELRRGPWLDRGAMRRRAEAALAELQEPLALDVPIGGFSLAQRQIVAIARAIVLESRLLVLDEPTASLSDRETRVVLDLVRRLRAKGTSVLYVSHRLAEVFELCDSITVLRDGRHVRSDPASQWTPTSLVAAMVGRQYETVRSEVRSGASGAEALRVEGLTGDGFRDVSLAVASGEVVGLGGLVGAGRSEVARAIFGIDKISRGSVSVQGRKMRGGEPAEAMRQGLALIPEDRRHEGLVMPLEIERNLSLADFAAVAPRGVVSSRTERERGTRAIAEFGIKANTSALPAGSLSGGNQQKVVLAKWLLRKPKVILLDEPTRGIDVGAKAEIHGLIRRLADEGAAVLVISSDMPELLALSDRIVVMRQGTIAGELPRAEATSERVLALALPEEVAA